MKLSSLFMDIEIIEKIEIIKAQEFGSYLFHLQTYIWQRFVGHCQRG
jgi:hypothetical protein